mmetsp:Transcript_41450/g.86951  ORF Transcript_41450/g.86951 Transcript_41450/m.86951 type:complete len:1049 (-) Transcript_41450:1341-4487(-)
MNQAPSPINDPVNSAASELSPNNQKGPPLHDYDYGEVKKFDDAIESSASSDQEWGESNNISSNNFEDGVASTTTDDKGEGDVLINDDDGRSAPDKQCRLGFGNREEGTNHDDQISPPKDDHEVEQSNDDDDDGDDEAKNEKECGTSVAPSIIDARSKLSEPNNDRSPPPQRRNSNLRSSLGVERTRPEAQKSLSWNLPNNNEDEGGTKSLSTGYCNSSSTLDTLGSEEVSRTDEQPKKLGIDDHDHDATGVGSIYKNPGVGIGGIGEGAKAFGISDDTSNDFDNFSSSDGESDDNDGRLAEKRYEEANIGDNRGGTSVDLTASLYEQRGVGKSDGATNNDDVGLSNNNVDHDGVHPRHHAAKERDRLSNGRAIYGALDDFNFDDYSSDDDDDSERLAGTGDGEEAAKGDQVDLSDQARASHRLSRWFAPSSSRLTSSGPCDGKDAGIRDDDGGSKWNLVRRACNETTGSSRSEHRNDKNDLKASFTFQEFRKDLSILRRSQAGSQQTSEWIGDGSSSSEDEGDSSEEEDAIRDEVLSFSKQRQSSPSVRRITLARSITRSGGRRSLQSIPSINRLTISEDWKDWARSFHHLDPRWQILTFFNDLALEGTNNLESKGGIISANARLQIPFILRMFARVGVFSVWRPTSNDAIRKMITGEGTGKGLDIKGKSALRGKYSGFVPFLQIHNNEDKEQVGTMETSSRVRVFYPNRCSRDEAENLLKPLRNIMVDIAATSLKIVKETEDKEATALAFAMQDSMKNCSAPNKRPGLDEMRGIIKNSRRLLNSGPMRVDREAFKQALADKAKNIMLDPSIYQIDDYASNKGVFGLDLPEKLFWEGYVANKDITREEGSEHDTGRASMPDFQVMNLDTLRNGSEKSRKFSEPRPVLYHAGCGSKGDVELAKKSDPLCPLGLMMAYEEANGSCGKVTPVVSDFDCFLLGTRGVEFSEALSEKDSSMLNKCIDDIEGILSTPQVGASWTKRWLEVKKKHLLNDNSSQEMPRFGYADPRSYTMMTGVVHRLSKNGAVRHGPECFNYGFPQVSAANENYYL